MDETHPPSPTEGERLWRQRWCVTTWGLLAWCALVAIAALRALAR